MLTKGRSIDRRGTNLNGMVIAAQALGFEASVLKSEEKLIDVDTPLPFIAHLDLGNQHTHFVVVYKKQGNRLWIADPNPEKKKSLVKKEEFDKEWTGYAVFLTPTPDFKPVKETSGKLRRYLSLLQPHIGTILKSIFASIILSVLGIIGSFYL